MQTFSKHERQLRYMYILYRQENKLKRLVHRTSARRDCRIQNISQDVGERVEHGSQQKQKRQKESVRRGIRKLKSSQTHTCMHTIHTQEERMKKRVGMYSRPQASCHIQTGVALHSVRERERGRESKRRVVR